jgi:hypothetical protein
VRVISTEKQIFTTEDTEFFAQMATDSSFKLLRLVFE